MSIRGSVGTAAAGVLWAAAGLPSSRRAAASITHDTADSNGAAGPAPDNVASTASTAPAAATDRCGVGTITGGTTAEAGSSASGAVNTGDAGGASAAVGTVSVASEFTAGGSTMRSSDRPCMEAEGVGNTVATSAASSVPEITPWGGRPAEARPARLGAAPGDTSSRPEFPPSAKPAAAGFSATRVERPPR